MKLCTGSYWLSISVTQRISFLSLLISAIGDLGMFCKQKHNYEHLFNFIDGKHFFVSHSASPLVYELKLFNLSNILQRPCKLICEPRFQTLPACNFHKIITGMKLILLLNTRVSWILRVTILFLGSSWFSSDSKFFLELQDVSSLDSCMSFHSPR